jgi:chorismate mutase
MEAKTMDRYTEIIEVDPVAEALGVCRERIDLLDSELAALLSQRVEAVEVIAAARAQVRRSGESVSGINFDHQGRMVDGYASHLGDLGKKIVEPLIAHERQASGYRMQEAVEGLDADAARALISDAYARLSEVDAAIAAKISERLMVADEVGVIKRRNGIPVFNGAREASVIRRFEDLGIEGDVLPEMSRSIILPVISASRSMQMRPLPAAEEPALGVVAA